jgi:hypothetical protein
VVTAAITSPPVTANSKASAYVRSATLLPSGAVAPPVSTRRPGMPNGLLVEVSGMRNDPARRNAVLVLARGVVAATYSPAVKGSLVTMIGVPSPLSSSASASCGPSG